MLVNTLPNGRCIPGVPVALIEAGMPKSQAKKVKTTKGSKKYTTTLRVKFRITNPAAVVTAV